MYAQTITYSPQITSGAFGKLSKSFDHFSQTYVASKKLAINLYARREIANLSLLSHSNVVRLLDCYETKGYLTLILDLHPTDLGTVIADSFKILSGRVVKGMAHMVFEGVAYCHSQNVIHRDIKPDNILISSTGRLLLCDFGHSKHIPFLSPHPDTNQPLNLPSSPKKIGSRPYKAPEVLSGTCQDSPKLDVWSVGCVMWELVAKCMLFNGKNDLEQLGLIYGMCQVPVDASDELDVVFGMSEMELDRIGMNGMKLLRRCLTIESKARICAEYALVDAYFQDCVVDAGLMAEIREAVLSMS